MFKNKKNNSHNFNYAKPQISKNFVYMLLQLMPSPWYLSTV